MTDNYQHLAVASWEQAVTVTLQDVQILDEKKIQETAEELLEVVRVESYRGFILDFSRVRFMSTSMWGRLVHILKTWKGGGKNNKCFILCGMAPEIFEVMKITRLDRCFEFTDNLDQAQEQVSKILSWRNS